MFSLPKRTLMMVMYVACTQMLKLQFCTAPLPTCIIIGFSNCVCIVPAVVHDGVKTVRDCQDRAVLKLRTDSHLNQVVCLHVHGRCGLIQNQNFGFPQQSSGQTQELPLTHTKSKEQRFLRRF